MTAGAASGARSASTGGQGAGRPAYADINNHRESRDTASYSTGWDGRQLPVARRSSASSWGGRRRQPTLNLGLAPMAASRDQQDRIVAVVIGSP